MEPLSVKTIGKVDLSTKDLEEAVGLLLLSRHGIKAKTMTLTPKGELELTVDFEVDPESPKLKSQPSGFKRKNIGFLQELINYLETERRKRKKTVTFDEAYKAMVKQFPSLNERHFMIYASDKRQQKSKGFSFDGQKRIFNL